MEQNILFVATFAFVFATLVVGGLRALKIIERHNAKAEAERIARVKARANGSSYTGGYFNLHGNQID